MIRASIETTSYPNFTLNSHFALTNTHRVSKVALAAFFYKTTFCQKQCCPSFFSFGQPCLTFSFKRMTWSVRSSLNDSSFSPSTSNSTNGRTRIIRVIQEFQTKLGSKIQEVKKNLPLKLFFFLVGFYCATAFATVIGQTGDWDILSAALAVAVVEGIGALMYRASLPLVRKSRSLISLFNYWKAGLTLGLFLDSFKY
ncbi:Ycf20-like protein [Glycine max]|uniref:Ycf20-like protein n=1 Tax=Glycine max TaxID=3847 RepID=A0A0R0KE26_SOYBN|nr:Ycf20-like protein [Glycine max]